MNDFGKRLRDKLSQSAGNRLKIALDGASEWIEEELMPQLETSLEELAGEGKERIVFRHKYVNDFRPEVADIEKLAAYQFSRRDATTSAWNTSSCPTRRSENGTARNIPVLKYSLPFRLSGRRPKAGVWRIVSNE